MGLPPGWTASLPEKPNCRHQLRRLSAVGTGLHIPSALIIMFLASVVQSSACELPATTQWELSSPAGSWSSATEYMANREFGLQPDFVVNHSSWFQDMISMLPTKLPESLMQEVWLHFQNVQIEPLLAFRTWQNRPDKHGTDIDSVRTRQMADRQINIAGAHGLPPPLLSPFLTQEVHLQQAMDMQHPFTFEPAIECDLSCAIQRASVLGPDAVLCLDVKGPQTFGCLVACNAASSTCPWDEPCVYSRFDQHTSRARPLLTNGTNCGLPNHW